MLDDLKEQEWQERSVIGLDSEIDCVGERLRLLLVLSGERGVGLVK